MMMYIYDIRRYDYSFVPDVNNKIILLSVETVFQTQSLSKPLFLHVNGICCIETYDH
jgi:hypothetical protein